MLQNPKERRMNMQIRRAEKRDAEGINALLYEVLAVHQSGRPDIFKANAKKYTDAELLGIIEDNQRPIFVAEDAGEVVGYAFCICQRHVNHNILTDIKTLYIDDLCVSAATRGRHIGKALYEYVLDFARRNDYYNVTLNVWACNEGAIRFYEKMGLSVQKIGMETIL